MLKRYKTDLYLKERISMTLRELVRVAHDEFRAMGLSDMARFMAMGETPVLVDVRGMFDEEDARGAEDSCIKHHVICGFKVLNIYEL